MRCTLTGTDLGDLTGAELFVVVDDVFGQAYVHTEEDANELAALINGELPGRLAFAGTDGGDLQGTGLLNLLLDGRQIGWAESGWLAAVS